MPAKSRFSESTDFFIYAIAEEPYMRDVMSLVEAQTKVVWRELAEPTVRMGLLVP